jgi:general secretion pathway protein D
MIRKPGVHSRTIAALVVLWAHAQAQVVLPPGFQRPGQSTPAPQEKKPPAEAKPPAGAKPQPQQQQQQVQPAKPDQPPAQQPAAAQPAQPGAQQPPPETTTTPPVIAPPSPSGGLNLQNASLAEVIDVLARQLKINYILDPRVKGGVTINTYGDTKNMDNRALLDLILNINGAAMIQVGDIYRIVPLPDVQRLPLKMEINGSPVPDDDRIMLNLIFLKYATVDELAKLLDQFRGEHAKYWSYAPANLLILQDTRRNMKRLMELVSLFDSDVFANQRVRLFEVKNSLPSDLAKELESILKSISLTEKSSPIKLLPVDRINTLIAVAPNAGVFKDVETWISKLDIAVESSAGTVGNYVYRVKYGFAPTLAMAIMGLYSNNPAFAMQMIMQSYQMGVGMSMGGGGMGMGMGGMGMGGMGMGGMGGMYGGGMYGGGGGMYGGGMYGGSGVIPSVPTGAGLTAAGTTPAGGTPAAALGTPDMTGAYLGNMQPGMAPWPKSPRIIPNPFDNTLLIQGTRSEFDSIVKLLRDIDVAPRQVLIDARIYEVVLTGALASGVSAFLERRGTTVGPGGSRVGAPITALLQDGVVNMTAGMFVGKSRELLAYVAAAETTSNARAIASPSIIATDSVPASLNVGTEVPTLTAQAVTGAQQGGNSLFANSIQSRETGTTLHMMARVNPSGVVTMVINQEVSAPISPPQGSAIQSPSFSTRKVQTQVTVQDGDTIAIGGIIQENNGSSSSGIPGLHRIPILGAAFGSRSWTKSRTELIIFLTPRVLYDTNDVLDATEELKSNVRKLSKYMRE